MREVEDDLDVEQENEEVADAAEDVAENIEKVEDESVEEKNASPKKNRTAPPRKKKQFPEVNEPIPAMTKREKLKEKVTCEGCNKTVTRHALKYTHKCPAPEPAVEDIEEAPPPQLSRAPPRLARPPQETTPGKDFMERLRVASLAYQQLERQKHSSLIRNFYGY